MSLTGITAYLRPQTLEEAYSCLGSGALGAGGSPLLRNAATIGGHLARRRYSDIVPVLLALDAGVTVYEGAERTLPLAAFYAEGTGRSRVLITEVQIPPAGEG